ncbi:MAG: HD domain-containing protein [Spirochaetales bacterium]|nr:HD domain-containing protein [Spirochaetales bacterium]
MLDKELIRKTEEFLKERFDSAKYLNAHKEAKAYRLEHTYRVANIGREIAEKEGFDETEMVIACLLHDVSYCEEFGENGWIEHGRRAAQISRPFLMQLGLAQDRVNEICFGIAIHVDEKADFPGEMTPFALTVGEADNIDRYDAYRIHEILTNDKFLDKDLDEKLEYLHKRIARLRELEGISFSTKTADEMWKAKLSSQIQFFENLQNQLRHSDCIV